MSGHGGYGNGQDGGGPAVAPVGRRTELLRLEGELERAHTHGARLVSIGGEPWVGKSRLAGELASRARARGWRVAAGRAVRGGAGLPFGVVVDALDDHVSADVPGAARLEAVFPALGAAYAPAEPVGPDSPQAYWLIRALRTVIEHLARPAGLLLVLDDAHRADPLSRELLAHLSEHPPQAPVVTVLVHRDTASVPLPRGDRDAHAGLHLDVAPLADRDAAALLPPALTAVERRMLLRDAAGLPGLLRALRFPDDSGTTEVYGTWELECGTPPALARSSGAELRASQSPAAWLTACAAAVLGGAFTAQDVARVADVPLRETLAGLDELQREGIVRAVRDSRFRFRHPAVRALVLNASDGGWRVGARTRAQARTAVQPVTRRRELDAARAELGRAPAVAARRLARHTASVEGLLLHARALVASGRPEQAVTGYAAAWPRIDEAGEDVRAEAVESYGLALRLLGRWQDARDVLLGAGGGARVALARQLACAALALESGENTGRQSAAEWAAQAACTASALGDGAGRARALGLAAAAEAAGGRFEGAAEAASVAAHALDALEPGAWEARLDALPWLTDAQIYVGRRREAERRLTEGFALAFDRGQVPQAGRLALGLATVRLLAEDTAAAADHADVAVETALRCGGGPLAVDALLCRARVHLAAGESVAAGRLAQSAAHFAAPLGGMWQERADRRLQDIGVVRRHEDPAAGGEPPGASLETLSRREAQVAALVSEGCTNAQIAARLLLSPKTVETYLSRIFKKFGIVSRAQVAHLVGLEAAARR